MFPSRSSVSAGTTVTHGSSVSSRLRRPVGVLGSHVTPHTSVSVKCALCQRRGDHWAASSLGACGVPCCSDLATGVLQYENTRERNCVCSPGDSAGPVGQTSAQNRFITFGPSEGLQRTETIPREGARTPHLHVIWGLRGPTVVPPSPGYFPCIPHGGPS